MPQAPRLAHGLDLHAPGAIDELLAFHRSTFGATRMEGEPPTPAPPAPTDPPPPTPTPAPSDKGFPEDTPLSEMNGEQREAYWKHQARKHEQTAKNRADYDDLKAKAAKHDALERELMSDKDKAVAQAKDDADAAARNAYAPKLVAAEFKAAAAGRIPADRLATIIEPLDLAKFLDTAGDVDTDKVSKFVDGIAPTTPEQRGPTSQGAGRRDSVTGASVASGRELFLARRKK
jgi:hypothetical protein